MKPPFEFNPAKLPPTDKASPVKMLAQSFDYIISVLPGITPEQLKHTWHIPSWKGRKDPDGRAMILNMFRTHCPSSRAVRGVHAGKGDQAAELYVLTEAALTIC